MKNTVLNFKMVIASSYGKDVFENVIFENATIEAVKKKYLELVGNYMEIIFDRNFTSEKYFSLPCSSNTIIIYPLTKL
jgi:hypothetical protein